MKAHRVRPVLTDGPLKDAIDSMNNGRKDSEKLVDEWRMANIRRELERDTEFEREEIEFEAAQFLGPAYAHLISSENEVFLSWRNLWIDRALNSTQTDAQKSNALWRLKELLHCQLEADKRPPKSADGKSE
jgi:hypothetical protein